MRIQTRTQRRTFLRPCRLLRSEWRVGLSSVATANFGSHSLALEGGGIQISLTLSHLIKTMSGNTKDRIAVRNNVGKTTPAATAPMANDYANAIVP
ncbi:hypothetical protein F2Q70_00025201 [Brassica cretica]|uniref:Uncharacterized protein n=1 Tax=Brassica cretica TaxID=69181 RepID=A0A8S9LGP7_BRACR|nr:hypothetical protein F2Q70_00025201 [Brassica cretica]